jgi:hypothetical protein
MGQIPTVPETMSRVPSCAGSSKRRPARTLVTPTGMNAVQGTLAEMSAADAAKLRVSSSTGKDRRGSSACSWTCQTG